VRAAPTVQVLVETCPQYLLLSQSQLDGPDGGLYTFTPTMKEPHDAERCGRHSARRRDIRRLRSQSIRSQCEAGAASFDAVYPHSWTETLLPLLFSEESTLPPDARPLRSLIAATRRASSSCVAKARFSRLRCRSRYRRSEQGVLLSATCCTASAITHVRGPILRAIR